MIGTTLKMRVDENASEKYNQIQAKKNFATNTNETAKRAALGELQNRGVLHTLQQGSGAKDAASKDLKDVKLQNALHNVKARVDTHWKKTILGVNTNAATNNKTTAATTATAGDGQRRMLLRSNSVRLGTTATTAGFSLQRQATTNALPTIKTATNAKVVENKAAEKLKTKVAGNKADSSNSTNTTTVRREDSNLSRKSLTKLRTALSRDTAANKPIVTNIQNIKVVPLSVTAKNGALTTVAGSTKLKPRAQTQDKITATVKTITIVTHSLKRLEGVEDIDADDKENLVLVAEYVNDIYDYLYSIEKKLPVQKDHLAGQTEVHSRMRAVLIDWINEVHMQFHLAAETFHMAVAIIDLYLQTVKDTKRLHLQLVGVTALFIATKYEELFPPAIADFVYITDDTYTAKQIRLMEIQILKSLDFNLSRPLPIHFLRRYSKAAGAEDVHHAMSKYFLELASIEYDLACQRPSEIAAASLFLSLHLLNDNAKVGTGFNNKHWNKTLEFYSHYTANHLRPITKKIATIARNASQAKLKAVYSKYKSTKFQQVSTRSELYGALMESIINSKD